MQHAYPELQFPPQENNVLISLLFRAVVAVKVSVF